MHVVKDIFYKIKKQGVNDSVFKRTFEFIFQSLKFQKKKYLKKNVYPIKHFSRLFCATSFSIKKHCRQTNFGSKSCQNASIFHEKNYGGVKFFLILYPPQWS